MSKKKKISYTINAQLCTSCATCVRSCPISIALIPGDKFFMIDEEYCITCGHCAGVCPSNAISCNEGEMLPVINPQLRPEDLEQFILEKRSVRNYKNINPSQSQLQSILDVGSSTATASNKCELKFRILNSEEVSAASLVIAKAFEKKLSKLKNPVTRFMLKFGSQHSYTRPRFMKFMDGQMQQTLNGNIDRIFFKAPTVIVITYPKNMSYFARIDAGLAAANMMLQARVLGLESCVVGYADKFSKDSKEVRNVLKVENKHEIGIVFTLGYPQERYYRIPFHAKFEVVE